MSEDKKKQQENPQVTESNKNVDKKLEEKPIPKTLLVELKNHILQICKSLQTNDVKNFLKITKQIKKFKKQLLPHHMKAILTGVYGSAQDIDFSQYKGYQADFAETFDMTNKSNQIKFNKTIEIEIYIDLILIMFYLKNKDIKKAYNLATIQYQKVQNINKRYFDNLNALVYFYYSRTRELTDELLDIREQLHSAYRIACVRHDEIGQATLLNLLLRNYLHYNHYEAAQHLISKTQFPEQKSNNEYCRYLYYTGRIKAIQLDYADSLQRLNQAIRKAPDTSALGFKIEVQKLACVVELLLGEIPNRDIFAQPELQKALYPYYRLVQAVLKGNLLDFSQNLAKYIKFYQQDKLYTLIMRLHQMVIKTGLRKINISYSKIAFDDVADKINLPKNTNVEFIIAKAIRDGVLNAEIDHQNQCIILKEQKDLYQSSEPQVAFQKRIAYCMNIYNQATKALQFPNQEYNIAQRDEDEINPDELMNLFDELDF